MSKQHEAIRLAERLESFRSFPDDQAAAVELRRLHAINQEVLAELVSMTDAYAKAMKDSGVSYYPEALAIVRNARAAIAKAKGEA